MNKTTIARGWPGGADNILADFELPAWPARGRDTPSKLRRAVNVDVLNSGKLRRRPGTTNLIDAEVHSVWSDGTTALLVKNDALCTLDAAASAVVLTSNLAPRPVSYTKAGEDIYWSNGVDYGRVSSGVAHPWGVEQPTTATALTAISGALPAGVYLSTYTYVTAAGEESAPGRYARIELTAAGGIRIDLPQPASAAVTHLRVYLSTQNGDIFFQLYEAPAGTASIDVIVTPSPGVALRAQHASRFLPCDLIEHYRGRIYGASGNILWFTEPYAFGLYHPQANYIAFPDEIRVLRAHLNGLYVVADQTYWLGGGGPDEFTQRVVLPYGAARRSATSLPGSSDLLWFGARGLVLAADNGQVKEIQADSVRPGDYADGAVMVKEQNSLKQFIGVVRNPVQTAGLVAKDFMDAEVIRRAEA